MCGDRAGRSRGAGGPRGARCGHRGPGRWLWAHVCFFCSQRPRKAVEGAGCPRRRSGSRGGLCAPLSSRGQGGSGGSCLTSSQGGRGGLRGPHWLSRAVRRDRRDEGPARASPHTRTANLPVTLCRLLTSILRAPVCRAGRAELLPVASEGPGRGGSGLGGKPRSVGIRRLALGTSWCPSGSWFAHGFLGLGLGDPGGLSLGDRFCWLQRDSG